MEKKSIMMIAIAALGFVTLILNSAFVLAEGEELPYWTDLLGNKITQTYSGNTVSMAVPGVEQGGAEGVNVDYTVKRQVDFIFGFLKFYAVLANPLYGFWQADSIGGNTYFKVKINDDEEIISDANSDLKVLNPASAGAGVVTNSLPSANFDNPAKNSEFKTSTGFPVEFKQSSNDSDDLLDITWEFGDGEIEKIENYSIIDNLTYADTIHSYNNGGVYTAVLKVKEHRAENALSAMSSSKILVFQEGINVIPVITSPAEGIAYGNILNFDASQSYVANCSTVIEGYYFIAGNLQCKYIHAPNTMNISVDANYDLAVTWNVADENGNLEFTKTGSWSAEYNSIVNFQKYLAKKTGHAANLNMVYREN